VQTSYLRGASGYLLVADGTRRSTFEKALELKTRADAVLGAVPFVLLLNKHDLSDAWELESSLLNDLKGSDWAMSETSAKTGAGVDEAFLRLGSEMLRG
jgi:GTPase SAR1 family protein